MNVRLWATTAMVFVLVPALLAQGQGGGRGGQRGGGAALLRRADVQKELNLSATQIESINAKLPAGQGRGQGAGQTRGQGAGQGGGQARGQNAEARAQMMEAIKGILDAKQFQRFQELELQRSGPSALARQDVAEKLKLSDAQKESIQSINQEQQQAMRDMRQSGGVDPEEMAKMREETGKKLLAVLTDGQRKQWEGMLGKAFKFDDGQ
ncbi:MAG: hypothetical protein M9921_00455 [Fimbriimonadaceae bacterium]|nr:hypothetical protein [Chthonomonadaceae bacterium]MCO5295305.1 hypothetical protein [Fimbriimonadaceae bacterium]